MSLIKSRRPASFIPRAPEDFGDGGAFPEIHVAQHPLGMGKDSQRGAATSKTVSLQYDDGGKLRFDALVRQGHGKDKIVHSRLADMKSKVINSEDETFQKPSMDDVRETTELTKAALEKLVNSKVESALPVQHAKKPGESQYIRYTSANQGNSQGARERIIRIVEEQQDPMEPPRFKINQKIPRPPPSPPAPVLHSPPRRVSAQEQADWKIPPCLSNWKNPKGYTVALDKRLAADGRGLQQMHINENFAKFAEAMSMAERSAREAVEERNQVQKRIAIKKKNEQQEQMHQLALDVKKQREKSKAGIKSEGDDEEARERDAIRRDKQDDIRKERNIARSRPDKLNKLLHDRERDISEKVALGLPDTRSRNEGSLFDSRLFDKSKGLDSGGIDDETYSAYDAPWRPQENVQQHIYRPTKNSQNVLAEEMDRINNTNRFVPEKGFSGASEAAPRSGPVQFEKQLPGEDLFGLDDLMQQGTRKRGRDDDSHSSKRSRH